MKPGLHKLGQFLGLAVTGLGALMASGVAQALDCNTTVTESVTLNDDIVCRDVGDVGITVAAGDVIIDLNGHTISGFKRENSVGIRVRPPTAGAVIENVTIMNGTIEFFADGVVIDAADDVTVTEVVSRGNRTNGIFVQSSTNVRLIANELVDNTNGIATRDGNDLYLTSNDGKGNSNVGFSVSGDAASGILSRVYVEHNESQGGAKRAAFLAVGPAWVTFTGNRAKGFNGFGFEFALDPNAPNVEDGGANRANGKPSKACFPDPCPLTVR
jgi:nitrous oxidase accessory protein NosD